MIDSNSNIKEINGMSSNKNNNELFQKSKQMKNQIDNMMEYIFDEKNENINSFSEKNKENSDQTTEDNINFDFSFEFGNKIKNNNVNNDSKSDLQKKINAIPENVKNNDFSKIPIQKYNNGYNSLNQINNINFNMNSNNGTINKNYISFTNPLTFSQNNPYNVIHQNINIINQNIYNFNINTKTDYNNNKSNSYKSEKKLKKKNKFRKPKLKDENLEKKYNYSLDYSLDYFEKVLNYTNKIDNSIYSKIKGKIKEIIKSQRGSLLFSNYLKTTHNDILHKILLEIQNQIVNLIKDQNSSVFIKKFIDSLNQEDHEFIINLLSSELKALLLDKTATYSIQEIIENLGSKKEKTILINSISPHLNTIAINIYGVHALVKIINNYEDEFKTNIIDYCINYFVPLCENNNGVCLIEKVLIIKKAKNIHNKFKQLMKDNLLRLMNNSSGNFAIHSIIDNWEISEVDELFKKIKGKLLDFSIERYSSTVIQKFFDRNNKYIYNYIIELNADKDKFCNLLKSNYIHYVIEKILEVGNNEVKYYIINYIKECLKMINNKKASIKWKNIIRK